MKKAKWFAIVVVSVMMLTGCGKKENTAEVLDAARKKMNELSNYAMKMEMKMGAKTEGFEMTIPIVVEAEIDEKSKTTKTTTTASIFGMQTESEGYTQVVDGKTITYLKEDAEEEQPIWTKESSEKVLDYKQFVSITQNSSKVEKKKSEDKNTDYYQVTISKEKMKQLIEDASTLMGDSMDFDEEMTLKKDVVMDIYVDKNTQYITKLFMDFKGVLDVKDMEEGTEITECNFTFTFSKWNQVGTITIPEEVIANAVEQGENNWYRDDPITNPEEDLEI